MYRHTARWRRLSRPLQRRCGGDENRRTQTSFVLGRDPSTCRSSCRRCRRLRPTTFIERTLMAHTEGCSRADRSKPLADKWLAYRAQCRARPRRSCHVLPTISSRLRSARCDVGGRHVGHDEVTHDHLQQEDLAAQIGQLLYEVDLGSGVEGRGIERGAHDVHAG